MKLYLNTTLKYMIILTLTLWCKTFGTYYLSNNTNIVYENKIYNEFILANDDTSFRIPRFDNYKLDNYVMSYIKDNSCKSLDYRINYVDNKNISIFLNCGAVENRVYNFWSKSFLSINELTKDKEKLLKKTVELMNNKYPKLVVDALDIESGTFEFKKNEVIYYNSSEFGMLSVKINNNEIRNLMNYSMKYDAEYENEKFEVDLNKKTVAFTFDDGPSEYDSEIVDILKKNHSSATFFLVGNRIEKYKKQVLEIYNSNMEIGNHTYNHANLRKLSDEEVIKQIEKTNRIYNEITGDKMNLLRPSYGAISHSASELIKMPVILWDVDTLDWKTRDAEKVSETILSNVNDGNIILMHSLYESTRDALKLVIPELYKRGYQIVSVEKLAEMKKVDLNTSTKYYSIK